MAVEVINTRYEILETLPTSDTTPYIVHKARDVVEGRVVALKVLPERLASRDSSLLSRLSAAIKGLGSLEHPMIGRTYEAGTLDNGDVYLVCDYLRGITLRERIRRVAPFSLAVASDIAATIAEALAAAHRAGVTHGRLLPRCVTLSPEGQIRVGDFGTGGIVADLLPDEAGSALPFSPPEADPAKPPTPSYDIYALGAILYEMLTGVLPTAAKGALPASPRAVNPGIPPALEGIALKALHPDLALRYKDSSSLLADLQAARAALRAGRSLNWSPLATPRTPRSPADSDEEPEDEPNKRSRKQPKEERQYREPPTALSTAVKVVGLIAVVGAGILFWKFNQFLSPPPDVTVPNLIGATVGDAQQRSHQRNFVLVQGPPEFSAKWPEGQIISQDPPANNQIKAGGQVTVSVSEGPRFINVPPLVGVTLDKAERALSEATLQGAYKEDFSDTVAKGVVISQAPSPGSSIGKFSVVNYVVSKGKQPPDAPGNVQAIALSSDRVQIKWQDAAHAKTYKVTRIADGGTVDVAKALTVTQFVDTGLSPETNYSYTVTSSNAVGESAPTDPVAVTTLNADLGSPDNGSSDNTTSSPDNSITQDNSTDLTSPSSPSSTSTDTGSTPQRQFNVRFRLPRTPGGSHHVKIEVQDTTGTTLVHDEDHDAGELLNVPVTAFGSNVVIRVYVDNALMKQQTL